MGTLIGSTYRNAKAFGTNGIDEYAYCDNPTFKDNSAGAVSIWVRPSAVHSSLDLHVFCALCNTDPADNEFIHFGTRWNSSVNMAIPSEPIPEMYFKPEEDGTGQGALTASHIFIVDELVHLVFQTESVGDNKIYVNGVDVGTPKWFGSNANSWFDLVPGVTKRFSVSGRFGYGVLSRAFPGTIDELSVFGDRLTLTEIQAIYNGGAPKNILRCGVTGKLVSHWRMGESRDDGTTIYDEVGTNHLTLVNADESNYVSP